jgi:hypothetical protein
VLWLAYGIRPPARMIADEAALLASFQQLFGRNPASAADWNMLRALTYLANGTMK